MKEHTCRDIKTGKTHEQDWDGNKIKLSISI